MVLFSGKASKIIHVLFNARLLIINCIVLYVTISTMSIGND